ncbi:MAG: cation transporter [Rubricoccaceae bacterium]|nr:cation transporter [Rubricoccaceae bacterium]
MRTETLRIEGMSCGHCVRAVEEALAEAPGVTVEAVEIGRAVVRYDDTQASADDLAARVEDAGYTVAARTPA